MLKVNVDVEKILSFVSQDDIYRLQTEVDRHHLSLIERSGKGHNFLGWMDIPSSESKDLIKRINDEAARLQALSDLVVVIGIGGSYLGAKATIEALTTQIQGPKVLYAGHHMSEDYLAALHEFLDKRDYSLIVISKSGTTTEPAIAFRLFRNHLEKKYGKNGAQSRIVAITDKAHGALKNMADKEVYPCFIIPDNVGGRFSVLTPVGLLPLAFSGVNIEQIILGALIMKEAVHSNCNLAVNPCALYAAARNALYRSGKTVEMMVSYEPCLLSFIEWWKQLYGESEGKQQKGIFPAGAVFTTDLHSMGQYIQDGLRILFETVLSVDKPEKQIIIPYDTDDSDGLNFLAGKRLHEVNLVAETATRLAHVEGGVPNIRISVPQLNAEVVGQLIYFFEFACALSGYMLDVNPFDQPGVEAYKSKMFALLGKPGY